MLAGRRASFERSQPPISVIAWSTSGTRPRAHDEGVLTGFDRTHDDVVACSLRTEPEFDCFADEQLVFAVEHCDRRQAQQIGVEQVDLRVGEVHRSARPRKVRTRPGTERQREAGPQCLRRDFRLSSQ